jgi:phytoene synthase
MSAPVEGKSNDRLFCWEQVNRTNPAFRVSQVFASRDDANRLLPLYALFSIIEQICGRSSDEDLARSKLGWWRIECSQEKIRTSHHPVMRELQRTGVTERLDSVVVKRLIDGAESRVNARSPVDISELEGLCTAIQQPQLELEMMTCGLKPAEFEVSSALLARSGLLQLIRESSAKKEQDGYWWVPLNLLARYGVSRGDFVSGSGSAEISSLWEHVFVESGLWADHQSKAIRNRAGISASRNFFAISGLYARKINELGKIRPNSYLEELSRVRFSDHFIAWKCARRLEV